MYALITASDRTEDLLPLFASLTDASRAQPGLRFILLADQSQQAQDLCNWAGLHPAVAGCVYLDRDGLTRPVWTPRGFKARRAFRNWQKTQPEIQLLIDPYGQPGTAALARAFKHKSVGVSQRKKPSYKQLLAPVYNSQFPIPEELHAVQAVRVLFAAQFEYTLNDLTPDYGLPLAEPTEQAPTDLVLDLTNAPWSEDEKHALEQRLESVALTVDDLAANPPEDAAQWQERVSNGRYLLCAANLTARLGAALGKPGVCVCIKDQASLQGAISSRLARQKMINVDQPPMNEPAIITESIIQAMTKGEAKIVLPEEHAPQNDSADADADTDVHAESVVEKNH